MSDFFESPILNSPYELPTRHWQLDEKGQPTNVIENGRRIASYVTPVARVKKTTKQDSLEQQQFEFDDTIKDEDGSQEYETYSWINRVREAVTAWRQLPESQWGVTPETARLLRHWRTHHFQNQRPFFCQIEAVEVLIWLTEVAPRNKKAWSDILTHIERGNEDANPGLYRVALKLATAAGKTTVMAMIIAWQTINAVRYPNSKMFTKGFLIVAPGLTIKDRLRVLQPNDPESYYKKRELIPLDYSNEIMKAKIVITNYHVFKLKDELEISSGTRSLLNGRHGPQITTLETEGKMLQRVLPELMGTKNILVINDEAHHCYREKPHNEAEDDIPKDETDEVNERKEMARLWISGLEAVQRQLGCRIVDLSATPFFLRGSGYSEGKLFPWTVSDFSLMDAIECGIVKLPRVPVADNDPHKDEAPMFRELWKRVGKDMPKKNRANGGLLDPGHLPPALCTAIESLYGHYAKTFELWQEAGMPVPPCFIFVCQNTAISKLIYDYISGYKLNEQTTPKAGHCPLFSNYDEAGNPLAKPRTILVDSMQLESGEALSSDFKLAASDEIERFKREIRERTGNAAAAEKLSDSDLLREIMNTVGKPDTLGGEIRCVVSVSMLTEGWDANNVTHILGLRAFGTQLICEQVIGRALRRANYELDENGHFAAEYADIYGIPFDFTAKATPSKPVQPRKITTVHALSPERDNVEIRFPLLDGYRVDIGDKTIKAEWKPEHDFVLSPDVVGPCKVKNEPVVGEGITLSVEHLQDTRTNTIIYNLTQRMLDRHFRDPGTDPQLYLFGQMKAIVSDWVKNHLRCVGQTYPAQILYDSLAETACNRITQAIVSEQGDKVPLAILNPFNPSGSTSNVSFNTTKDNLWKTSEKCHINYAVLDSEWEGEMCRVLEANPHVVAYVKNRNLGFTIPYLYGSDPHDYVPDFIVKLDDGRYLILEVKGFSNEHVKDKKSTTENYWIPAVNKLGSYGVWSFAQFESVYNIEDDFRKLVDCFIYEGEKLV